MPKPKRVSYELLDDFLKELIQSKAKIWPIMYVDIQNHVHHEGMEYARVIDGPYRNTLYRWHEVNLVWEIMGADDSYIIWSDIQEKPTTFTPAVHTHPLSQLEAEVYTKTEVNGLLVHDHVGVHSMEGHIHDERYMTQEQLTTALAGKSDTTHVHDTRYYTQNELDTALAGKVALTTYNGHVGNSAVHVTTTDKDNWNAKSKVTLAPSAPADPTDYWFEEVE